MVWKKNAISYIIWLVYAVMAGSGFLWILERCLYRNGIDTNLIYVISIVTLVAEGVLVLVLYRLSAKRKPVETGVTLWLIAECILAIGLLAAGVLLRIHDLPGAESSSVYLDMARVAEGQSIPLLVHGMEYLYLQLLHLVFLLFGNKLIAGIWFQLVLQLLACVFLYCGVRKQLGNIAAVVTAAFLMLSPLMREEVLQLSSRNLFLLLFGFIYFLLVELMTVRRGRAAASIVAGIVTMLLVYLDVLGGCLLILALGMLLAQRDKAPGIWNSKGVLILCYLLGGCIGAVSAFGLDAGFNGKSIFNIVLAWWKLFTPEEFTWTNVLFQWMEPGGVELLILLAVMCIGCFSFWCIHKTEQLSIWTLSCVVVLALGTFGMLTPEQDGGMILFFFSAVCSGVGIMNVCQMRRKAATAEQEECLMDVLELEDTSMDSLESEEKTIDSVEMKKTLDTEEIVYIENPLPLPKKHTRRTLDYSLPISDNDDYDVVVSDDDDYDV